MIHPGEGHRAVADSSTCARNGCCQIEGRRGDQEKALLAIAVVDFKEEATRAFSPEVWHKTSARRILREASVRCQQEPSSI